MLHTLTHVENIAIELSWDIAMRYDEKKYKLPKCILKLELLFIKN